MRVQNSILDRNTPNTPILGTSTSQSLKRRLFMRDHQLRPTVPHPSSHDKTRSRNRCARLDLDHGIGGSEEAVGRRYARAVVVDHDISPSVAGCARQSHHGGATLAEG